jgi:phosphohistidine phosphatase
MSRTLLLLRHAKSSWDDPKLDDHDRPLNKRGKSEAPRIGKLLVDEDLIPDLILSSSAKRARRTAEKVADECCYRGETLTTGELYMAGPTQFRHVLASAGGDHHRVLVVAHNPGIEEFFEELVRQYEPFTTAALAQIELSIERWDSLDHSSTGRLINMWQPRELA